MAFIQVSARSTGRHDQVLSADNAIPERHIVVDLLRNAAPLIGLKAPVIATLDAMLSCLPPKRTHHTVFASNATLTFRRNGISDRTIRRHAAILEDIGLLIRRDSPNRKRFSRRDAAQSNILRFGFDLSPLFQQLQKLASLAAAAIRELERIGYLRTKIRAVANDRLRNNPNDQEATTALRLLRRKLTLNECDQLFTSIATDSLEAEQTCENNAAEASVVSGNDGQFVRHYQKSNKEHTEESTNSDAHENHSTTKTRELSIKELMIACPKAAEFCISDIRSTDDVVGHGRTLAPMLGIDKSAYHAAEQRLGIVGAATTVWALMQFHEKIKKVGAYFRAITSGAKSADFNPFALVRRLASLPALGL